MSENDLDNADFTVVHTGEVLRDHKLLSVIDGKVTHIHLHGHPFLCVLKKILEAAPNLKALRVIPSEFRNLKGNHCKLLIAKRVGVIVGHQKPEHVWRKHRRMPRKYKAGREYLKNLAGHQKELFDELLKFRLVPALMASRYFCLNDEPYVPLRAVITEFGCKAHPSNAHNTIHGVLQYLDPVSNCAKAVQRKAAVLKTKVARIRNAKRREGEKREKLNNFVQTLGIAKLPDHLEPSRHALFEQIVRAYQSGRLESVLKKGDSRAFGILKQRWGLENNITMTLSELSKLYGISGERIRQIEQSAFKLVGINS